jgi:putative transposase
MHNRSCEQRNNKSAGRNGSRLNQHNPLFQLPNLRIAQVQDEDKRGQGIMKAYKTEVILSPEQKEIFYRTLGVMRKVYNLFIEVNDKRLLSGEGYMNNFEFSKWLNNEYMRDNPDKGWIKEVSSKAVRNAIDNAHKAYKRFFKRKKEKGYQPYSKAQIAHANRTGKTLTYYDQQGHPKRKARKRNECSFYFVRNDKATPIEADRHRIKIPTLGWVQLKEYGYIPTADNVITSGTITVQTGRFYISVITTDAQEGKYSELEASDGIGIDVGIKTFATVSNGQVHETDKQRKLNKRLRREQRKLSRKYEAKKKRNEQFVNHGEQTAQSEENKTNPKKGGTATNIDKQTTKIAKLHQRIANIRNDRQNKIVDGIVRAKPSHITIEDLNVRGLMKNKHLSRATANQGLYTFRMKLTAKAKQNGIEVRIVDRFYPSSKTCHECGYIKKDLKLKERIYRCNQCGHVAERDMNASLNLRDCMIYTVA